ncbi:MAG: hypothetical protein EKK40_05445 [Bradyrhizobiaceae bacterium]|nr:MAG: hypothetical protein EKK40_05445 [Bradyrhizobiaceae bacterium]
MDDDKPGGMTDDTPLPQGSKRPGPTIELTATDVTDKDAGSASADSASGGNASNESSGKSSSRWRDSFKGYSMPRFRRPSWSWPSSDRGAAIGSMLARALTSAIIAALVTGAVLLMNRRAPVETAATSDSATIDALRARIAALETKTDKPVAAATPAADPALTSKVAGLEKSLAALRDDIAKLRAQDESNAASIEALKAVAQESDAFSLEERLTKLERATVALTADKPARPAQADPTVPRVAAAALLNQIVSHSEPYEAALNNTKRFGDTGALKALEPFAATGVPSAAALSGELLTLLPQLAPKPVETPVTGGFFQRLQESAMKLVRVRRIGDAQSDDLLARVRDAAQRQDVSEARRLLMTLPDAERAPVQSWIDKVDARDAALRAARNYAQDAMSVMPRPADPQ